MSKTNNPRKGIRHQQNLVPCYIRPRPPTTSDKKDPLTNLFYELNSLWTIGHNRESGIPVASGTTGALWYLSEYNSSGDAIWLQISTGGTGAILKLRDQVNAEVAPDGSGLIDLDGAVVAAGANPSAIPVETVKTGANSMGFQVQVAAAITGAPADKNDAGLCSFDNTTFAVDANGYVTLINNLPNAIGVYNIGFDYNSGTGTFSITSDDGTALSSSNPGYVVIWTRESTDPGKLVTIPITANVSFLDAASGSSEIVNNLFGLTTGLAYGRDLPFAVKAVLSDDETSVAWCLSRNIFGLTSPAAANIGAPDDAVANAQNDYWSFDNLDETLFESNPALNVGTIYMRMSASDDWTVQGLYSSSSGSNYPSNSLYETLSNNWRSVEGHFGAASGSLMKDNSGTAPTFTVSELRYQYAGPQTLRVAFHMSGNTATDGAGAVTSQIAVPYSMATISTSQSIIVGSGYLSCPAYTGIVVFEALANTTNLQILDINGNYVQNQDFSDGSRTLSGEVIYRTGSNP